MFIKDLYNKNKLFANWLFSYIIILFVAIMIMVAVNERANVVIRDQTIKSNNLMLENAKVSIDNMLTDMTRVINQIILNKTAVELAKVNGEYSNTDLLKIMELKKSLANLKLVNGFISDIYIYFNGTDKAVTTTTMATGKEMFEIFYSEVMTFEQWQEYMMKDHVFELTPIGDFKNNEEKVTTIAYIQSIGANTAVGNGWKIAILLDNVKFTDSFNDIPELNNSAMLMLDQKNTVLISTGEEGLENTYKYENLNKDKDLFYEKNNGKNVVVSYVTSDDFKLKYISIMVEKSFWKENDAVRRMIYFGIALLLLIGGVLSVHFSRKNYSPVNSVILKIEKKLNKLVVDKGNEFSFIEEVIDKTFNEKEKAERMITQQSNLLRDNYLSKLLKGRIADYEYATSIIKSYGIEFFGDYFIVAIFYIEDYEQLFKFDYTDISNDEKLKVVRLAISNVVGELLSEFYTTEIAELDDNIQACIINLSHCDEFDLQKEYLNKVFKKAQDFLKDNFLIVFTVSLSYIHKSIYSLAQAYHEATDVMEYRNTPGESKEILWYDDIKFLQHNYNYPIDMEYKLINLIKDSNFEEAAIVLERIFEFNYENQMPSPELGKCLKFDVLGSMLRAIDGESSGAFLEELRPAYRISNADSINDVKNELHYILEQICIYCEKNRSRGVHSNLVKSVTDYINKNYFDVNLCVLMVGEHFKLTSHYLSKLFKEQTGEGLLDYINKVRVTKARQFLIETDFSISQIAEMVGYTKDSALIRIFKRYQGITPGKFRELKK